MSETNPPSPSDVGQPLGAEAPPATQPSGAPAQSPLAVRLEQFEGPLDLLLHLIRSQKINIYDIPIARITQQYLTSIRQAEQLNIDLGGEFVFMAATLIHIKSRMLLPVDPSLPEEEQQDPRQELVEQLLEHEKFVQAAEMLREKRLIEDNVWSNPSMQGFLDEDEDPGLAVSIFDLVKTFEQVLDRAKNRATYEVSPEEVSVASRVQYLRNLLLAEDKPVSLREVFERQPSRAALIATFLAVLELVRMQAIVLRQKKLFDEIVVRKHKMFDAVFSDNAHWYAADQEYQQ